MSAGNGIDSNKHRLATQFALLSGTSFIVGVTLLPLALVSLFRLIFDWAVILLFGVAAIQLAVIHVKYRLEARHRGIEAEFKEYLQFNAFGTIIFDLCIVFPIFIFFFWPLLTQHQILFYIGLDVVLISIIVMITVVPIRTQYLQRQLHFRPIDRDIHPLVWDVAVRSGVDVAQIGYAELSRLKVANAYQAGDGRNSIVMLSSYLDNVLNEEELAAITAHELAHVRRRHFVKRLIAYFVPAFLIFNTYAALKLLEASAVVSRDMGTVFSAILVVVFIGHVVLIMPWLSRRWEIEADLYASSVVSPKAMVSALTKLAEKSLIYGSIDKRMEFLISHPVLESRIRRISSHSEDKDTSHLM